MGISQAFDDLDQFDAEIFTVIFSEIARLDRQDQQRRNRQSAPRIR